MTPKEKSIDLVDKFKKYAYYPKTKDDEIFINQLNENAKECALIAVNEIISCGVTNDYYWDKKLGYYLSFEEYYIEVKQEIEKL